MLQQQPERESNGDTASEDSGCRGGLGPFRLLQIVHKSAQVAHFFPHDDASRSIGSVLVLLGWVGPDQVLVHSDWNDGEGGD